MRVSKAIKKIKKHNRNGLPLCFYEVDRKSNFYRRIMNYVMKHKTYCEFQLYTQEYSGVSFPYEEWEI